MLMLYSLNCVVFREVWGVMGCILYLHCVSFCSLAILWEWKDTWCVNLYMTVHTQITFSWSLYERVCFVKEHRTCLTLYVLSVVVIRFH